VCLLPLLSLSLTPSLSHSHTHLREEPTLAELPEGVRGRRKRLLNDRAECHDWSGDLRDLHGHAAVPVAGRPAVRVPVVVRVAHLSLRGGAGCVLDQLDRHARWRVSVCACCARARARVMVVDRERE
jgi:hypothetical protein